MLKFRRVAVLLGALSVLAAATAIAAPAASAATKTVSSGTSAKDGYGVVGLTDAADLYVCDEGTPDGLRAVGIIYPSGYASSEVQDANGSNAECVRENIYWVPSGTAYTLTACLRDGASGSAMYCRSVTGVFP